MHARPTGTAVNSTRCACLSVRATTTVTPCAQVDANDQKTPGWRYNYWELKGVPVRVEVGPRDVESHSCVLARRDVPGEASACQQSSSVWLEP
jgi:prolyl-tRNA synthetase